MSQYADAILETMRQPLLVLDASLRVKIANRAFYKTFKVPAGQPVGRLIYELGDGQWNIPALRKLLDELLPTDGEFTDYPVEHDFPDIGRRTMLLNARRLRDGDNNPELILLAIEDVTERRRAEAEVGRQRTWFATTLASIGDAVIAADADARVTYLNPTAEAMTGWSQGEAVGKPLHEVFNIVNEETRVTVESPVIKAIRQDAFVGLANHTLLLVRDGIERPIDDSAAPIRDENGNIVGVVLVFHEISKRRQAEQLLETSEIRYRRLFEAAHDGILILDTSTRRITDVNPFMMGLLDYPREHFIGKELWEIGIFRDKEANQSAMQELHEVGSIRFENLPLQDRNGRRHPVEIVANIYREDHATVIQCNIRDIAERVMFERERAALLANEQAARMEAEAANRSKDIFLATLSHELRSPLHAILGWTSILQQEGRKEEDLQEGLEVIERNCSVQAKLIEDVLDVSRIVSGKLQLEISPCDLVEVIGAAVDVVRSAADAKGIVIHTELDPSAGARASCDANRIQQVVWNLLTNAIKFTPNGGSVRVELSRDRSATRIAVSDTGAGIAPEFLPHVFERFRQADGSTRRKFGGLGLGLSIVKHLVELHGGSVQAESAGEGRGSTFTLDLPIHAVHAPREDEAAGGRDQTRTSDGAPTLPAPIRLDHLRVLVVDDEPDALRLIAKVLDEAGAHVTLAASAAEALEVLEACEQWHEEGGPEFLVSDLGMPAMDGFDLIRAVRSSGHSAEDLPAVALTAFAHKDYQRRALLAGFQVHVPKPVDPHDLLAVVASLAGRTGLSSDALNRPRSLP